MSLKELETYFGAESLPYIEILKKEASALSLTSKEKTILKKLYDNPVEMSIAESLYNFQTNRIIGDETVRRVTRTPLKEMGKDESYLPSVIDDMVSNKIITVQGHSGPNYFFRPDYLLTQNAVSCMDALRDTRPLLDIFKQIIRQELKSKLNVPNVAKEEVNKASKALLCYIMT